MMTRSISDIRHGLEKGLYTNAVSVCDNIVRRLLIDLGWPQFQPDMVIREHGVSERGVDFALCATPLKPLVFIRVKQIGDIKGTDQELFEITSHDKVPIAILTDGQGWYFFHPTAIDDYREQMVCQLDLIVDNSEVIVKGFNRYLNYERICNGKAVRAIKADSQIHEAWRKLLQEADVLLLDVVAEKVKRLCGDKPNTRRVLDFLKNLSIAANPIVLSPKKASRRAFTRLVVVMPDGEVVSHPNASDTFREVVFKLGPEEVLRVDKTNTLISTQPKSSTRPYRDYHITTGQGTIRKKRLLERTAESLGVNLKVEVVEK